MEYNPDRIAGAVRVIDTTAEKDFKLRLSKTPQKILTVYKALVLEEKLRLTQQKKRFVDLPLETRENYFKLAQTGDPIEEIRRKIKMERDWEAASRNGRPPIGGADDLV